MKIPKTKNPNGFVLIKHNDEINLKLKEASNFFEIVSK
jgi:hypothetical protein